MKLSEMINIYGPDARLVLRGDNGISAVSPRYIAEDFGVWDENENVYDLLSQSSLHDLEQKHQTGALDFFSLVVVDV